MRVMAEPCIPGDQRQPIQLEPFVHQVGGHSSMLRFDDTTVCKPLIKREHHFYETTPGDMKEFVAEYRGVIEVCYQEDGEGFVTFAAQPTRNNQSSVMKCHYAGSSPSSGGDTVQSDSDAETPAAETCGKRPQVRMKRGGSIEAHGRKKKAAAIFELIDSSNSCEDSSVEAAGLNPWSLRCHREQLSKMRSSKRGSQKFILLENIASTYETPCILDLKMGTRQHGDDVTDEKRSSKMLKCRTTTTSSLGVRICGMQVFQVDTGRYVCRDKYYGRRVNTEGFRQTLYQFLHNGHRLRVELIQSIVKRLQQLHDMLSKQMTFRFYASSLLVMYEGADLTNAQTSSGTSQQNSGQSVHSQSRSEMTFDHGRVCRSCPTLPPNPRPPCLVNSLLPSVAMASAECSVFSEGESSRDSDASQDWPPARSTEEPNFCQESATKSSVWCTHSVSMSDTSHDTCSNKCESEMKGAAVDIRMIDFAHATHEGFRGDRTVHSGPDHGYLFGLKQLMKEFLDIGEKASEPMCVD